jgi:hypothetical protein
MDLSDFPSFSQSKMFAMYQQAAPSAFEHLSK